MIVIRPHKLIAEKYPKLAGVKDIQIEIAQTKEEALKLAEEIRKNKLHNLPTNRSMIYQLLGRLNSKTSIRSFKPETIYKFRHKGENFERPACIIAVIFSGYKTVKVDKKRKLEVPNAVGCVVVNYRYTNHFTAKDHRRKGYGLLLWDAVTAVIPAASINILNATHEVKLNPFFEKSGIQLLELKYS